MDITNVTELLSNVEKLKKNLYLQYLLVATLKHVWLTLTNKQKDEYIGHLCRILPRLQGVPDPRDLAHRILQLKDEDIYAVLKYEPARALEYEYMPGEEMYPTHGWIGAYLSWARSGNAPLGYHFWSSIAVLGAACQRRVFFPGGKHVWMSQYIVLGGLKSCGKGQAFEPAIRILRLINEILSPTPRDAQRNIEKLINILPADATQEALVNNLANKLKTNPVRQDGGMVDVDGLDEERDEDTGNKVDATGIIPLDEMATFFGKDAWGVAKKAPWLATLMDTDRYDKETKGGGMEILENTAVSMLACCAPDWMHNTIEADLFGGGFMDRCVWVYRDPVFTRRENVSIVSAQPKDPLQAEVLAQWVIDHLLELDLKVPVILSPKADKLYSEFHRDLVRAERAAFMEYGSDAEGRTSNRAGRTTLQLASLLSLSEGDFPPITVQEEHLEQAIKIVDYEEHSMEMFMGEASRRKDFKFELDLLKAIKNNGGCMRLSELTKLFSKAYSSSQVKTYVQNLYDQDRIEQVAYSYTGGRPAKIYRVPMHSCGKCQTK